MHPSKPPAPSPRSLLQAAINSATALPFAPVCSQGGTTALQKADQGGNWCLSTTRLTPDEMINEVMLKNDDKNNCSVNQ